MPSDYGRRTLLGAALAGLVGLAAGGYTWNQYSRRHDLRLRPLEVRNESTDPATIELAVHDGDRTIRRTERLTPVDDDADRRAVPGRWMKHARPYAVRAELEDEAEAIELEPSTITGRLGGAGWGVDCAHLTVVVTTDRSLETRVDGCAADQ